MTVKDFLERKYLKYSADQTTPNFNSLTPYLSSLLLKKRDAMRKQMFFQLSMSAALMRHLTSTRCIAFDADF